MTKKLNKADKAFNIVKKLDDGRPAGELVMRIAHTCNLNVPAARTYLFNARRKIEKMETEVTVQKARKATVERINVPDADRDLLVVRRQRRIKPKVDSVDPAGVTADGELV